MQILTSQGIYHALKATSAAVFKGLVHMFASRVKPQEDCQLRFWQLALAGFVAAATCNVNPAWSQNADDPNAPKVTNVSVVLGGRPKDAFTKPYGYYLNPILQHIHANPEQKVKITAILQSYRGRLEPLRTEYRQKNQELLNKLSHGDKPEAIMDEQTHLGRLYTDITLYYCQMSLEVRKCLSPDQIVLYEEFKRKQGWRSTPR